MTYPSGEPTRIWPVEIVELSTLTPHPANYREHDIGAIMQSIARWGVWRAMVVQRSTNYVIVGCGEYKALVASGETHGPVRFMDVDDDNARAILLADNWIPSRGRNMPSELLALMQELAEERELLEATGADEDDLDELLREVEDLDKPLKLDSRKAVKRRPVECPACGEKFVPGATKE